MKIVVKLTLKNQVANFHSGILTFLKLSTAKKKIFLQLPPLWTVAMTILFFVRIIFNFF